MGILEKAITAVSGNSERPSWEQLINAIFSEHLASVRSTPSVAGEQLDMQTELTSASSVAVLAARVAAIYAQTPMAVLSLEEVAGRLEVSNRICAEVMMTLVRHRLLRCTGRGEYVLR